MFEASEPAGTVPGMTHDGTVRQPDETPEDRRSERRRRAVERARRRRQRSVLSAAPGTPSPELRVAGAPAGEAKLGQYPDRHHRRVTHGVYLERRPGLDEWSEFVRDLQAIREVLPPDAVFTHLTAAALLGWDLPVVPEQVPVFAATSEPRAPRRPGIICSRLVGERRPFRDLPVPVDQPVEILLRCARDLGYIDLMMLLNSAVRLDHVSAGQMESLLLSRRPGVAKLRRAWRAVQPRVTSPEQTLLWLFLRELRIGAEVNVHLRDPQRRLLARAQFRVRGTRVVVEVAPGATAPDCVQEPRSPAQQRSDEARRDRLLAHGPYLQVTVEDLITRPAATAKRLCALTGHRRSADRITRWQVLVEESLLSPVGRERLMNRWHREMGLKEVITG